MQERSAKLFVSDCPWSEIRNEECHSSFPIKLWMIKFYEFCPDCSTAIIGVILDTADWPRAICWCSKLSTAVRLFRDTDRATTPITFSSRTWINHSLQQKSFRKFRKLSTLISTNVKCKLGFKFKLMLVFGIHLNLWHCHSLGDGGYGNLQLRNGVSQIFHFSLNLAPFLKKKIHHDEILIS